MRLPQRLELEIEPDLYERIEEISIRSGRSIPEIIQGLISCSFSLNPVDRVFRQELRHPCSPRGQYERSATGEPAAGHAGTDGPQSTETVPRRRACSLRAH